MKHLISLITSIKPVLNSAFSVVITEARERTQKCQHLNHQNTSNVANYWKLIVILFILKWTTGQLVLWQADAQQIFLTVTNWLIFCDYYLQVCTVMFMQLMDPLKDSNSKTMNVPEVSEFLPAFRSILRHF